MSQGKKKAKARRETEIRPIRRYREDHSVAGLKARPIHCGPQRRLCIEGMRPPTAGGKSDKSTYHLLGVRRTPPTATSISVMHVNIDCTQPAHTSQIFPRYSAAVNCERTQQIGLQLIVKEIEH